MWTAENRNATHVKRIRPPRLRSWVRDPARACATGFPRPAPAQLAPPSTQPAPAQQGPHDPRLLSRLRLRGWVRPPHPAQPVTPRACGRSPCPRESWGRIPLVEVGVAPAGAGEPERSAAAYSPEKGTRLRGCDRARGAGLRQEQAPPLLDEPGEASRAGNFWEANRIKPSG
nr:translation initiation factor IF-2-like [Chlorocebus sabaeus]